MASIPRQIIPISFGQGIDTKPDQKQQIVGKLRKAKNIVFETIFSAKKRNGYESLLLETSNGDSIETAQVLTKFKRELCLFDDSALYSFSNATQKMQAKGSLYNVMPDSTPVLNNNYNHDSVDVVFTEQLSVYVYHNTILGDVRYSVKDQTTKSILLNDVQVAASSQFVRVARIQNFIYIVYANGSDLKYRRFNVLTPDQLESAVSLASNVETTAPNIDVASGSDKIIVVYNSTVVGAELRLFSINSAGVASSIIGITGANPSHGLNVQLDSSSKVVISYSDNSKLYYLVYAYNLAGTLLPITEIETLANITTSTFAEPEVGQYIFYYTVTAAATGNYYIKKCTATAAGLVGTPSVFLRSVGLAAKAFRYANVSYIPIIHDSTLQATYFLANEDAKIVTKWGAGNGGGHVSKVVPHVEFISDTEALVPNRIKTKFTTDNGAFFGLLGIEGTVLDFNPENPYSNALLADNLHIASGVLQMYDGNTVVEHGFNVFPETLTAGSSGTSGGFMSDGNYGYKAVYRWTDNFGNEHRSAPSADLSVTLSGGGSTQKQAITIPTLRLTSKSNVVIELYSTESDGTIYYLVSSVTAPTFNTTSADTVSIERTISDTTLISQQPLYTTGGVLENIAAPTAKYVATHVASSRVFLLGLENSDTIQYSKIQQKGSPVEFNDDLTITLDPIGGKVTCGISMDEKFIIFQEDAIKYIAGLGPTNTGEQNSFTDPEDVAADVGCTEPRSLVYTPIGVMFKSRKGIYLLDKSLGLRYIGAEVEEYNGASISSAKIVPAKNQVRFTTSDNDCLVYNYQLGLWSTFDNHKARSAEIIENDYYYLRSGTTLFKENSGYSDNGVPIRMRLETGWLNLNGLQGFMRVYRAMILGDYKSEHKLRFRIKYNFNDSWVQEKYIDPADFVDVNAYGDYSPYGDPASVPYGGTGNPYQARIDFKRQKCQSIKLLIEDSQLDAGEGLSLSAITLEVGAKQGLFRTGQGQTYGTD